MPASPSTARAINDRLALRLLQQEGPLTAGQLKKLTGLSRPTVADLVERLTDSGLITVVGESGEQRRGPNAKLYGIVADRAHLAALDVRTEGVAVLVSDLLGRVLAEASVPIGDDTGTGSAVEQAVTLVERVAKEAGADRLHTLGIGAPGLIDPASGDLHDSSGLPEWHRRLIAALQERFPRATVSVENETNLAALAEQRDGAARDRDTFVLLWLGMGIGAAVVLDGTLRRGASGGAGEIGFLPVPGTTGLPSATGCDGGFHSLAGAGAVADLATTYGVTAPSVAHEPRAAALVRAAVETVAGAAAGMDGAVADGPTPADSTLKERGVTADRAPGGVAAEGGLVEPQAATAGGRDALAAGGRVAPHAEPVAGRFVGGLAEGGRVQPQAASGGGQDAPTRGDHVAPHPHPAADPSRNARAEHGRTAPHPAPASAADRFLDALADRVALGAAAVVAVLDPGCVVLAGEVGRAGGEVLARRVQERLARLSPLPTEVRPSALGGGAVLRGALLTARDRAQDELFAPRRAG